MYFPREEYETRWQRVHQEMKRRGYEAAVVWGRGAGSYERCGDVLYLSNFYSTHSGHEPDTKIWNARSFAAVLLQRGQVPELHIDEPEPRYDLIPMDRIQWHFFPIRGVAESLKTRGIKGRVALVGSDFFPVKYMDELRQLTPMIEWVFEDDLVGVVRRIKSPRELDAFRVGGINVSRGLNRLMECLVLGKSEAEAAAEASREVVRGGGIPSLLRCSHGDKIFNWTREPLTGYSLDSPVQGDLVRGWVMGPMFQGYWLDPGRTAICGRKPSREQKELVEDCASIVEGVMKAYRVGVSVKELARVGDEIKARVGGEDDQAGVQWPLYGHHNGLFFELPFLGKDICEDDDKIQAGVVCSSEAFLARPGVGAAGFEQNFIVLESGIELLTQTPMLWW